MKKPTVRVLVVPVFGSGEDRYAPLNKKKGKGTAAPRKAAAPPRRSPPTKENPVKGSTRARRPLGAEGVSMSTALAPTAITASIVRRDEEIMQRRIRERTPESQRVIDYVQTKVPEDRLVKAAGISFASKDGQLVLAGGGSNGASFEQPLTRYALGQAASRVGFPAAYAADVMVERGEIGRKVVADALSTLWANEIGMDGKTVQSPGKKVLIRSVDLRIHAVLSDAYRRLDARPGIDSFVGELAKVGAVPFGGYITETRVLIRAILPKIFHLHSGAWNDAIVLGAALQTSDFGASRYKICIYFERPRCKNGAIGETTLAQTHVGGRLEEGDFYSNRTYKLDAATVVSATRDQVRALLAPAAVEKTVEILQLAASRTTIDFEREITGTLKRALTKDEIMGVRTALQSVNEDEMPLGPPTPYRMSQALSWVANAAADPDRTIDLQKLAGTYLAPAA